MPPAISKRLGREQVRKLIAKILQSGGDVRFTDYCERRMSERGITAVTIINVLERGIVREAEEHDFEGAAQWRYRVETDRYRAVVTFEIETEVIVINAIDFKIHLTARDTASKKGGSRNG
ncbi:MAG TPA: DUF4258 domain-containing protein [Bdellovibrionota bacterium]|nr:DUF4258 domain-containing protein [Bdellovibrionota bacterium]